MFVLGFMKYCMDRISASIEQQQVAVVLSQLLPLLEIGYSIAPAVAI